MAERQFEDSAKPGDLIEVSRGIYKHWAVYIGGDEVVHLTVPGDNPLMLLDSSIAEVRRDKLFKMSGFDSFRISNFLDDKYEPRERHIIVRKACRMVGRVLPYCVFTRNCEHFVTELRYGKPESRQVKDAAVMAGVTLAGLGIVALGVTLGALFSAFKDDDKRENRKRHH